MSLSSEDLSTLRGLIDAAEAEDRRVAAAPKGQWVDEESLHDACAHLGSYYLQIRELLDAFEAANEPKI